MTDSSTCSSSLSSSQSAVSAEHRLSSGIIMQDLSHMFTNIGLDTRKTDIKPKNKKKPKKPNEYDFSDPFLVVDDEYKELQ